MVRKATFGLVVLVALGAAYLVLWPVPIDPVAWDAPTNEGYVAPFEPNDKLANITRVGLGEYSGPEDAAIGPDGMVYIATHEGAIVKYDPVSGDVMPFAETGGRPLGVEFDNDGNLYVADAFLGLLKIGRDGQIKMLASETKSGSPIQYANDVDIAADGNVYFTDASSRFGAQQSGGTLPASFLDLMEHSSSGRILKYDPATGNTAVALDGFSFANGLAMTSSGDHYLVVETGTYSIKKVAINTNDELETIIENLPGFPDNINRNADGTFWVGIVSPRSDVADALSNQPFLRKVVMRLPASMRPAAQRYGFVIRINEAGDILETLQGPSGAYALTTGLIEGPKGVRYITSLTEPDLAVLEPK